MKKNKSPYSIFDKEELILRDYLAIDRTILSNESTFLAYIRTSLAVIAAGATLIHFIDKFSVKIFGGVLIIIGLIILVIGYLRYRSIDKEIKEIRKSK